MCTKCFFIKSNYSSGTSGKRRCVLESVSTLERAPHELTRRKKSADELVHVHYTQTSCGQLMPHRFSCEREHKINLERGTSERRPPLSNCELLGLCRTIQKRASARMYIKQQCASSSIMLTEIDDVASAIDDDRNVRGHARV